MLRSNTSGRDAIVDARRIAVRYFQSPDGNDSLRLLADGLTEGLIATLAQVPGLDVVSSNGVAQFRDAAVSRDSLVRVLQPGTLIEGEVESAGASVRVTVRVVDAGSGAESQHASLETPAGSYLALGDSLARQAALFLRERLGAEVQLREQRATTGSSKAWVLWHQAQRAQRDAVAAADTGDSSLAATHFGAADSLATLASAQDRNWNAPVMLRATTLYRRSRFAFADLFYAGRLIAHGLMVVDTALRRDPDDPDGLELRGNLQYWKYLLRLEQNPGAARTLLANARADLERATQLGPTQAGAWASLSHLYYNVPDKSLVDVVLAARRAYEADAWLANAPVIIGRLFYGYYDMDQPVDATHWCTEGHRRFPGDSNFTLCRLFLMTMRGQTPDPDAAWRLARSEVFQGGGMGGPQAYRRAEARMQVSCVLARAGLSDSAKAVAQSALLNAEADPTRDLYLHRAACLLFAGDKPAAVQALGVYLAVNPERRREFFPDPGWRLRPLVNDPAYMALVGGR